MAKKTYIGVDDKARKVKKMYIGVDTPLDYTELEYIESDGGQYIDTKIIPDNNTRVVMDFELTDTSKKSSLFGTSSYNQDRSFGFNWNGNEFQSEYYEDSGNKWGVDDPLSRMKVDVDKETTEFNNEEKSYDKRDFSCSETLKLMASGKASPLS